MLTQVFTKSVVVCGKSEKIVVAVDSALLEKVQKAESKQ